jgi:uncharacterized protein (UPF0335 family)
MDNEAAKPGHNLGGVSADQLRSIVERIERLDEEKSALTSDISGIYKEAKSNGFDVKVLRQIIRLRKMDQDKLAEQDAMMDLYRSVMGI